MALGPAALLGGLAAALVKEPEKVVGEGDRSAVGENALQVPLQVLGWLFTDDRDVVDMVELEAEYG